MHMKIKRYIFKPLFFVLLIALSSGWNNFKVPLPSTWVSARKLKAEDSFLMRFDPEDKIQQSYLRGLQPPTKAIVATRLPPVITGWSSTLRTTIDRNNELSYDLEFNTPYKKTFTGTPEIVTKYGKAVDPDKIATFVLDNDKTTLYVKFKSIHYLDSSYVLRVNKTRASPLVIPIDINRKYIVLNVEAVQEAFEILANED